MSKITPKNLSYDTTLPPFLARMQANNASLDGRHEFQAARPKKPRNAEEDAEDEPIYFDEGTGESLTKGEWELREKAEAEEEGNGGEGENEGGIKNEEVKVKEMEKVAAIGVGRKRKAGKVIGVEDENAKSSTMVDKEKSKDDKDASSKSSKKTTEKGKPAKKSKKIKLSFGDDE